MSYALVTGASNGIGYELSLLFARDGHNLILVSRRKEVLFRSAEDLEHIYGIKTLIIPKDLSGPDAAEEIFRIVHGQSISIDYLVNNAGFYVKGAFSDTSWEDEQRLIYLQCLNYTWLIKLFLPGMLRSRKGRILNVCSTGSFVPGPYNAVYCAAKGFVLSLSEAISEEISGSGVTVTALCPGGTKTAFQDYEKTKRSFFSPLMGASEVARIGYRALMRGKKVIIPGTANKIQVFMIRFIPRGIIARLSASMVPR